MVRCNQLTHLPFKGLKHTALIAFGNVQHMAKIEWRHGELNAFCTKFNISGIFQKFAEILTKV